MNWLNSQKINGGNKKKISKYKNTYKNKKKISKKYNSRKQYRGGVCGCGSSSGPLWGGNHNHKCKMYKGGNNLAGNLTAPGAFAKMTYPNGLIGKPWHPEVLNWSGVDGTANNHNYLAHNNYKNDIQLATNNIGANPPFNVFKGGYKNKTKRRNYRGGNLGFSNFMTQDLLNIGRQLSFNMGSAYNTLNGYSAPIDPQPWKNQLGH